MHNATYENFVGRLSPLVVMGLVLSLNIGARAQSASPASPNAIAKPAPLDRSTDWDERIKALIRKMTLTEKIGQLQQSNNADTEAAADSNRHSAPKSLIDRI